MAQPAVDMQQLMAMMAQLIQNQAAINPVPQVQAAIVPPLPDVVPYEHADDNRSRINEWIERFEFSLDCAAPNLADDLKVKALMNKLSESAFSEYSKFILPAKVTDFTFKDTTEKLQKLFAKQQSVFIDRFDCLRAEKEEHENFKDFVNRHKRLLKDFEFVNMNEEQFKVLMLLLALKAPKDAILRQKILAKLTTDNAITYDGIVEECSAFLATITESKMVEGQPFKNVNMIRNKRGGGQKNNDGRSRKPSTETDHDDENEQAHMKQCWRCGGKNHSPANCRHKSSKCFECGEVGHLRPKCDDVQKWKRSHAKSNGKNVGHVRIGAIMKMNGKASTQSDLCTTIKFNRQPIKFKLDCGTEAIVVNLDTHKLMGSPGIQKCSEQGQTYDETLIPFIGKSKGTFEFEGKEFKSDYYVAKNGAMNLMGINGMNAFGLLDDLKMKINGLNIKNGKFGNANEMMMAKNENPKCLDGKGPPKQMMKTAALRPQQQNQMHKMMKCSDWNDQRKPKMMNFNEKSASKAIEQSIKATPMKIMGNLHQKWNASQKEFKFQHLKKGEEKPWNGMKKKAQKFALGEEVLAWHRPTQEWLDGGISRRKGFLYDVIFSDGFTSRFHVSRLRKMESWDEDDQKSTMNNSNEMSEPALTEPEQNEANNENEVHRIELSSPNEVMEKAIAMGHSMKTHHSS
jgi:hypothetical protein